MQNYGKYAALHHVDGVPLLHTPPS